MCGIAGIRAFGDDPITEHHVNALLMALEHRGTHATGIAYAVAKDEQENELGCLKDDEPAWKFLADKDTETWIKEMLERKPDTVLLHTRMATQGTPRVNDNNHPLTVGVSSVVHNGMISNDDTLFASLGLKREAETDSDIIRAILDKHGLTKAGIRELGKLNGSAAIAVIHRDFPKKFLLARSGNPLVYAFTKTGLMFWASEKQAIHHAQRDWEERYGIWVQSNREDMKWNTMPDNSAYIFGPEGLEWRDEFKIAYSYTPPRYRGYETYHEKNKMWDEQMTELTKKKAVVRPGMQSPTWAVCPECQWSGPIPEKLQKKALWTLVCGNKHALAPKPARTGSFD